MSDKKLSRREFLERAAALGAVTLGAGTLLSACDPPDPEAQPDDQPDEPAADDGISCNDDEALAGLSEDEIARRENHEYVDQSPVEGEYCDNCALWEDPEPGEDCGGCSLLPGPFHPEGWCNAWVAAG